MDVKNHFLFNICVINHHADMDYIRDHAILHLNCTLIPSWALSRFDEMISGYFFRKKGFDNLQSIAKLNSEGQSDH